MSAADHCHRFEGYRVDTLARELRAPDGAAIPVTAKAFDTLVLLIAHRDRVVGKDELLATVWAGRVVEENNLTQAISALRRALGTGAGDHRFIVTVPGRGYRFVAPLADDAAVPAPIPPAPPMAATHASGTRRGKGVLALGCVLALVALAAAWVAWRGRDAPPAGTTRATLAVLPFHTIGAGPRDALLEQGLSETLIARISHSHMLRVRSSSSSRLLDPALDPIEAGQRLGAEYIVEGSIQHDNGRVRVGARLLSVRDGGTVWAGTFDEASDRVFTLQDRLAGAMTSALAVELEAAPGQSPCAGADPVAYRAYLMGLYQGERPSGERMHRALALFQRAIELDPACALAYAGMAQAWRRAVMTGDADPRQAFPLAKAAAEQALRIAPDLPEAHAAQGFIRFWYDWDWEGAEASLQRAISLNPSLGEAELAYAHLLANLGRHEEAIEHAHRMVALDPLSPLANTLAARFLASAGREAQARQALAKALELEPDFWIALLTRGAWRMRTDPDGAVDDLQRARAACDDCSQVSSVLGEALVRSGRRDQAQALLRDLQARSRQDYVPATAMAAVHNALGETDAALAMLERGCAERDVGMSFLRVDPRWDNLRTSPRFQALMSRLRLADPALARTTIPASTRPSP